MVIFFHIFTHGDVINAQTWEVSPLKNPCRATLSTKYRQAIRICIPNSLSEGSSKQIYEVDLDGRGNCLPKRSQIIF